LLNKLNENNVSVKQNDISSFDLFTSHNDEHKEVKDSLTLLEHGSFETAQELIDRVAWTMTTNRAQFEDWMTEGIIHHYQVGFMLLLLVHVYYWLAQLGF
jgi:hypothetical protein